MEEEETREMYKRKREHEAKWEETRETRVWYWTCIEFGISRVWEERLCEWHPGWGVGLVGKLGGMGGGSAGEQLAKLSEGRQSGEVAGTDWATG